jgi:hypothetical protein
MYVQENGEKLKLKGTYEFLIYADDYILGKSMKTQRKYTRSTRG